MKTNRITLVTLAVRDLERAKKFYTDLGWVLEEGQPDVCFFDMGGAKFGLYDMTKLADDLGKDPSDLGTGAMTLAQNFETEADVDAAYAAALSAGATPCKPPEKVFWGGYSGTYADPDGHVWEVAMNPFWKLDKDGALA